MKGEISIEKVLSVISLESHLGNVKAYGVTTE